MGSMVLPSPTFHMKPAPCVTRQDTTSSKLSLTDVYQRIDEMAIDALYDEINLELKPGLVCPSSQGSHKDMDYNTFMASISALRGYFAQIAQYGYEGVGFDKLRQLGVYQEQMMLAATCGINTHRGAIFNLGFIAAAMGRCLAQEVPLTSNTICQMIKRTWQEDILYRLPRNPNSHGQLIYKKYGITGAIHLVAHGFEIIRELALPCYYATMNNVWDAHKAKVQTLMMLICHLDDTNLAWRGNLEGLRLAQKLAKTFLDQGGVFSEGWQDDLQSMNDVFVERNLSPGGSADLLAVTLFFVRVHDEFGGDI